MTVRIRGIYATALTERFREAPGVVQPSDAIADRFADELRLDPAGARIDTTDDRQGVGVVGDADVVATVLERCRSLATDVLAWADPTPRGAVYDGQVRETTRGGAVVDLDVDARPDDLDWPRAGIGGEGFLPWRNIDDPVDAGEVVRVQVVEPTPPWGSDRAILDESIEARRPLVTLSRRVGDGDATGGGPRTGAPDLVDVLPTDPQDGWVARWANASEEADLDALDAALDAANERAETIEAAVADAPVADGDRAPRLVVEGRATAWVWFGREARFALDRDRRAVTATMPGHHRIKAGADAASAAVDFVEALTPDLDANGHADGATTDDGLDFPFDVVTRHFGPQVGDDVSMRHGKPDGRCLSLGDAEVTSVEADGSVTVRRELSGGGTYDGLGVEKRAGDIAVTKLQEGRWWYPTVYRSADDELRGTYVNVCTPVEVFPDAVRYVDLHVDVVKRAGGTVERLDDDELDEAEAQGFVSESLASKARAVASAVETTLGD